MWPAVWRLPAGEAESLARRLEATGCYQCVVFPLREGEALLHAADRQPGAAWAFRFRTLEEAETLLADAPRQLPLWDAAG